MTLELRSTGDGHMYEVCLTEDGITECAYVSSMHLVDDKERQLKAAIKRRALNAFVEHSANSVCDI
jgi:hypothetical protein